MILLVSVKTDLCVCDALLAFRSSGGDTAKCVPPHTHSTLSHTHCTTGLCCYQIKNTKFIHSLEWIGLWIHELRCMLTKKKPKCLWYASFWHSQSVTSNCLSVDSMPAFEFPRSREAVPCQLLARRQFKETKQNKTTTPQINNWAKHQAANGEKLFQITRH